MAGTIPLAQIGDYIEKRMEQLLRVVVLDVDTKLKNKSPVDLGRFRLSWAIGENEAPYEGAPPGDYRGQAVPPLKRIGYSKETLGNVYSIHNNLPYAERLAEGAAGSGRKTEKRKNPERRVKNWAIPGGGSSRQTKGPGWVQLIAKDAQTYAIAQAAKIGRES